MKIPEILEELKTEGFAHIPSSISQDTLKQCTDAFRDFIKNTPLTERVLTDFRYDPSQRFNLGFRDKSTSEGFDEKCYFHFNPHIRDRWLMKDNIYYQKFLDNMEQVYHELDSIVHEVADGIIALGYAPRESFYNEEWETNNNMRILQYRPNETCEYLAKPHTDRGIFTMTIYETDPGLQFYTDNSGIVPMKYEEFTLKMFPADYWNAYVSFPLKPLTHDVIKEQWNTERSSIVFFVNPSFWNGPHPENSEETQY